MSQRPTGGRELGEGTSGSSAAAAAAISAAPAAVSRQQQDNNNCFLLLTTGQIESVEFIPSVPNVYCKYCFVFGPDWRQVGGPEEGISATGHRPSGSNRVVLNTPVEATFASTNPFKWPQIVFSFYGQDAFGNDVIRGYSATHLPTVPGRTKRKCPVFIPQASTAIQRWLGLFTGRRAEFVDARIAAMSEGREVTRVSTLGFVELSLTAVLRDTKKFGYDMSAQTTVKFSEFPLNWPASTSSTTSVGIASASFAAAETSQAFEQRRPRFGDGGRERAGAGIETIQESEEEVHGQPATVHHHQHRQQEAVQVETTQVEEFDQS